MTFTELDLTKNVSEMSEAEAKETLSDFMRKHSENQEAYDEVVSEYEDELEEKEETIESLEDELDEWREELAEEAAECVEMPANLLAAKFSRDELEQIISEASEHSEEEEEEDDEPDRLTTFSDKEQKGKETTPDYRNEEAQERAKKALASRGFPVE